MDQKKRLRVNKANALIEAKSYFVNGGEVFDHRLGLWEQKVVLSVISKIQPKDKGQLNYTLTYEELSQLSEISIAELKRKKTTAMLVKLRSKTIAIFDTEDAPLITGWFSDIQPKPKDGLIEFSVSPKLKPYLLDLNNNFTSYHLKQVVKLGSVFSIRLYELLRQYLPLKSGRDSSERVIELGELRSYLGLADSKYKRFQDFKRHVLLPAKTELEDKTDLTFDFEGLRVGRSVGEVKFSIHKNVTFEAADSSLEGVLVNDNVVIDEELAKRIRVFIPDIKPSQIDLLFATYTKEELSESLVALATAVAMGSIEKSPLSYYQGVLSNKAKERVPERQTQDWTDTSWEDEVSFDDF
ncbi:replication initiation protein [Spartinivicinus ruber]|uniref:replication initiation protein n=1 Tax=Spartinivicinus ruber TaxID=2683272 RepID=UPI0013D87CEE|nr:replication initiation protein [Spartinivicinus ruber]